jgi:1,4-dihydroxy-2-naphthoate octaprenyltransferase
LRKDHPEQQMTTQAYPETHVSVVVWLQTARVQSWAIATISVLAGAAVAWWQGHASAVNWLAWITAVAAQAGTNLTNVSFNYKAGAVAKRGAHVDPNGSSAAVRAGVLTPMQVRAGATVMFTIAAVAGVAATVLVDPRLLWLGVAGIGAGYFYAAPPLRLAYRALGVVTVFLFFGLAMVLGTYFIAARTLSPGVWAVAMSVGLLAADVMHTNDLRDYDGDVSHGKRTLSAIIGRDAANLLLLAMVVAAYGIVLAAALAGALPKTTLLVFASMPLAVKQLRLVFRERDPGVLNGAWFLGVKLHTAFGVLLIAGLVLATLG